MAQQIINIGSAADDGTGDVLRTALDKANSNFSELYSNNTEVSANSAHRADTSSNPHAVTAAQVGSMTEAETQSALNARSPAGGVWFEGLGNAKLDPLPVTFQGNKTTVVFWTDWDHAAFSALGRTCYFWIKDTGSTGAAGHPSIALYYNPDSTFTGSPADRINIWFRSPTTYEGLYSAPAEVLPLFDGTPKMVATTFDMTGVNPVIELRVNGQSFAFNEDVSGYVDDSASHTWSIGSYWQSTVPRALQATMRLFTVVNRTLTSAEVQTLYDHGGALPAGPEWRWGDVTVLTSGTLETGASYRINTFNTGDDFNNVGAASNATGEEFTATGTTPTTWTNSSELVKIGTLAHLPMDETAGSVCYDASPNGYDATLSATGWERIKPGQLGITRARSVDASSATYMLRASDILDVDTVIDTVVVDGESVHPTGAQTLTYRRIRLAPSGSDLLVQRSNGTTHETIATVTPASLSSVDVQLKHQKV